jgi:hypothetical protein
MIPAVGQMVQLRAGELWIDCTVIDVKNSWGKNRLLLAPVAGDGTAWFEMSSVRGMSATVAGRAWTDAKETIAAGDAREEAKTRGLVEAMITHGGRR